MKNSVPELPSSWARCPIGEVVEPDVTQTNPTGDSFTYVDIGSIDNKLKRITEAKTLPSAEAPSRARQLLQAHDVLVSMTRPNLNAVTIVPPNLAGSIGSTGFNVLRAKGVEPRWLYYYVQTTEFIEAMSSLVQGALYPAVRPKDIRGHPLPVAPFSEQVRVADEIERHLTRLDAGVEALKRVQAQLKRYRASVLKAACEGRLVPTEAELARREKRDYEPADKLLARLLKERRARWEADQLAKMKVAGKLPKDDKWKAKYVEPEQPDTEMLPPLSEGWSWASLDQLSWTAGYGTSEKCDYEQTGLPVLRIPNISQGQLDPSDLKFASTALEIDPGSEVALGDLIIVRTNGSKDLIGRGAVVVARPARKYYFASYLIRYRLIANEGLLRHISAIWHAPYARTWVQRHAATSAGQYNISMGTLARFPVPLPPAAEQSRITAQVDALLSVGGAAEPIIAAAYSRANRLRQALLKLAFEGGLVPQDPNDEHAAKLLKRISAAATNEPRTKQSRTKRPGDTTKMKATR